jgi:hypothetical protein
LSLVNAPPGGCAVTTTKRRDGTHCAGADRKRLFAAVVDFRTEMYLVVRQKQDRIGIISRVDLTAWQEQVKGGYVS